ncbi:formate dehydrogenase subunit alpha [Metallosphaera hakonensis]|uniref:Formate dehydrogenase subunit alpha n=1 Tax=Metallosphaera hakonensis JCM 8857 = DSM 7519 TaxID=1293036 RepID=A0A2U9IRP4_9CREN|nr:formate dehydrogenase subunit alpha [Metallosphaera hakonensis]AWR98702.1 formate dehydrogenase subunit alpha [Metallosphaera hakonensis JCM 8857 = DSM 7519]
MEVVKSICPFCGVGCGVDLYVDRSTVVRLSPAGDHVVSKGHLCGKGTLAYEPAYSWDRLAYPLKKVKEEHIRISWDMAIKEIVAKLKEIIQNYGSEAVAFYGGCQNTLEEVYLMQKLARALGTNNVDSCARVCHEPSATALKEMVGIGASSISVEMIPKMNTVVIAGESVTESHPVLSHYLTEAKKNGTKLVVIDPRITGTAKFADLHIRLRPGTDIALFNGVGNYLIENSLIDKEFIKERVTGFEEYVKGVSKYTLEFTEKVTGVVRGDIQRFAQLIALKETIFSWGLGLTQSSGVNGVRAYINLALLTGNVGKRGGLLVFRGQTNVQGSGDLVKPNVFPNGPMNDENAERLARIWNFKPPVKPGLPVTEALLRDNDVKAIVFMGYNPVASMPNRTKVEKRLRNLDLLVVIDAFMTDTARLADYVLPAAVWAEKEGSVSSLDRIVKWRFKATDPPGEAKPDHEILRKIAEEFGYVFVDDPKEIFEEIKRTVPVYSNLTLDEVMDYSTNSRYPSHEITLYDEKFYTESGKGKLIFVQQPEVKKEMTLITVRNVTRYNTDVVSGRIPGFGKYESPIYLSPDDAVELEIGDNEEVMVASDCGKMSFRVKISREVQKGTAVMYMHDFKVNYVVCDELDEITKIPKYKQTKIKIVKLNRNDIGGP